MSHLGNPLDVQVNGDATITSKAQDFNHDKHLCSLSQSLTIEISIISWHRLSDTLSVLSYTFSFMFPVTVLSLGLTETDEGSYFFILQHSTLWRYWSNQCYSCIIATAIIAKFYFLLSLLAMVPNNIMGTGTLQTQTFQSSIITFLYYWEDKLSWDHLSSQKYHIFVFPFLCAQFWQDFQNCILWITKKRMHSWKYLESFERDIIILYCYQLVLMCIKIKHVIKWEF